MFPTRHQVAEMNKSARYLFIAFTFVASSVYSADEADEMSHAEFDALFEEISNWGRWGKDDQIGTLNLITPEKRVAAAALVKEGVSISLSLDLNKHIGELNTSPLEHEVTTSEYGSLGAAMDELSIRYHGYSHSHIDGLQHIAHKGLLYNRLSLDSIQSDGSQLALGIQHAADGIVTRGVLIDVPRFRGVDFVPSGTVITEQEITAWEQESGVTISSGDVLLIRTGRWIEVAQNGQWDVGERTTGFHASIATWLKSRDVAVLGMDATSDVAPSRVEDHSLPLHVLTIAALGMPLLDNLDLEALAATAAKLGRPTFLFIGAPLRVPGGTGSPLNPLAVF